MKGAVVEYVRIAGANVNFDQSSVLGGVAILFQGPSAGVTDPSASSGCGSGPTSNWAKLVGSTNQGECSGGNLAFKEVVLKGQGGGVRHVRLPPDPLRIGCTSSA